MRYYKLLLIPFFAFALAACSGDEETSSTGVASAADLDETVADATVLAEDAVAAGDSDAALTGEEAALALAECMRNGGFDDFPDPQIDADGNVNLRDAIVNSGLDFQQEGFRELIAACNEEVGAANFGAGARGAQAEGIQEALLSYTNCLRDEGLDVGDLDLGGGPGAGGVPGGAGGAGGAGRGGAQGADGNVANRGGRIAQALGVDVDDPATAAALTACESVLDEAFAGFGGGPAPAGDDS